MRNAEELLSRFQNVRAKETGKYTCDCPVGGRAGHVYITVNSKSAAMFCQGCKAKGDEIARAVGLRSADLFFRDEVIPLPHRTHVYHNADGTIFGKKEITKKPDGSKACSCYRMKGNNYVKGLQGDKAPLYNLEALASTSETVYFAEGEKDCDTLEKMGLTATSAPNGANQRSWPENVSEYLAGRDIVILTDHDAPGEEYGAFVAQNVSKVAASVKVIPAQDIYPAIEHKGDILDIVAHIGLEEARRLVTELTVTAPLWDTPADESDEIPDFFEGKKFRHDLMGEYLIRTGHVCKINGALHIYHDGIYVPGEELLQGYMLKLESTLTEAKRREVIKYMDVSMDTPIKEPSPEHLIPFKSRVYNLKEDKFEEYNPSMVFLNRFPYDYNPDALAQELDDHVINDIACGDEKVIELLYEAIGNCFYRKNEFRGSILLYGENGSNGKSTLLNMIIQLLGNKNVSTLSLKNLSERFRLMPIYGKAANIGDDISEQYIADSSIFKKLVTGEYVVAENKGQAPISFRSYAKLFFAANALPKTADKSKAFLSRVLPVPLMADFSKAANCDTSLKERVWSDAGMEYFLALAMAGLKRLLKNKQFTMPESVLEARNAYERENNSVLAFLDDYDSNLFRPTKLVYQAYLSWCKDTGVHSR